MINIRNTTVFFSVFGKISYLELDSLLKHSTSTGHSLVIIISPKEGRHVFGVDLCPK